MPAFRPMTPTERETIRRDVPRLGCRIVAERISAVAVTSGRRPVSLEWVRDRARTLDVSLYRNAGERSVEARQRDDEAGRLHLAGYPLASIARKTDRPVSSVSHSLRRFYARLDVPGHAWNRRGQHGRALNSLPA